MPCSLVTLKEARWEVSLDRSVAARLVDSPGVASVRWVTLDVAARGFSASSEQEGDEREEGDDGERGVSGLHSC